MGGEAPLICRYGHLVGGARGGVGGLSEEVGRVVGLVLVLLSVQGPLDFWFLYDYDAMTRRDT